MLDRGLGAMLDRKALTAGILVVSLALDLVRGPVAGLAGMVTVGWLFSIGRTGLLPAAVALALSAIVAVVQATLWTFLYHARIDRKDR
jgi:hypothetical protein